MDSDDDKQPGAKFHQNQPYDESLEVPDAEDIASVSSPNPHPGVEDRQSRGDTPPDSRMTDSMDDEFDTDTPTGGPMQQQASYFDPQRRPPSMAPGSEEEDDEEDESDEHDSVVDHTNKATYLGAQRPGQAMAPASEEDDDDDDDEDDESDDQDSVIDHNESRPPPPPHEQNMYSGAPLGGPSHGPPKPLIPKGGGGAPPGGAGSTDEDDDEDDEDDEDDDDDDDEEGGAHMEGAYDPAEYEHLAVTPEIKELFQYITRYTPQTIDLDNKLKPFIPDYIPAVGDIDAFIKIPRPDSKPDTLGLTVLDEPCAKQSDPTVLDLQLRALSKQTTAKSIAVKSIDSAEKNPKAIDSWIESISELHRVQPPVNVHYTKNMPDIDSLMQEWPPEFEELLKEINLPTADIDCDLPTYVDLVCSILDIPVYKSRIQSLHLLFTLYSEFKNSQHFRGLADKHQLDNALKDGGTGGIEDSDQLIL